MAEPSPIDAERLLILHTLCEDVRAMVSLLHHRIDHLNGTNIFVVAAGHRAIGTLQELQGRLGLWLQEDAPHG